MKHYFYNLITLSSILFLFWGCVPVQTTTSNTSGYSRQYPQLSFENLSYREQIRTVQLVKFEANKMVSTNNAVIELGSNERLLLTFDDLNDQQQRYNAKIIHCNKDWTKKSNIQAMDYLEEFNQFPIRDFEFSFDTKMGYIHYSWNVPKVQISGNYLLVVYKDNNEDDIILSERFMVHENKASINYKISVPNVVTKRRTHQELEFEILLENTKVLNLGSDIQAVIRQNNSWLYSLEAPEPFKINANTKKLTYKYYNGQLNFPGRNEYRFFDISTVNFKGNGVDQINKEAEPIRVSLKLDQSRASEAYREWQDRNGAFAIGNRERQNTPLVSDYLLTEFNLKAAENYREIYVVGEFNNWQLDNSSKMKFNVTTGLYQNNVLLKQGYYEYSYYVVDEETNPIEGDHYNTENTFDILVYYDNHQLRYDRLIGYTQFNSRAAQ